MRLPTMIEIFPYLSRSDSFRHAFGVPPPSKREACVAWDSKRKKIFVVESRLEKCFLKSGAEYKAVFFFKQVQRKRIFIAAR